MNDEYYIHLLFNQLPYSKGSHTFCAQLGHPKKIATLSFWTPPKLNYINLHFSAQEMWTDLKIHWLCKLLLLYARYIATTAATSMF